MGTSTLALRFVAALVLVLCASQQAAQANYILTPKLNGSGASSVTVAKGGTTAIDFILSSTGSDVHDSAIFQVTFSAPGLTETTYLWASPYANASPSDVFRFDDSTPNVINTGDGRAQTPATITQSTFVNNARPTDIDIEFNNITQSGKFSTGNLVTMSLQVPASWSGPNSVTIAVIPDTFDNVFTSIPTTAGPNFTLNIGVPEPGSLSLAGFSLGAILLRRRRRSPAVHGG